MPPRQNREDHGGGPQMPPFSLAEIVDRLARAAEEGRLDITGLMRITGRRGLGAMLLLPCLIILSPIGLLPGVPATMSALMVVIALHMIVGAQRLWLPPRLGRVSFPQRAMRDGLRRIAPYAGRVDGMMTMRFAPIADSRIATLLAALTILAMSVLIMLLGFVPGLPALMALAVLFCGLGLAAHNSLFLLAGYVLAGAIAAGVGLVFWL